MPAGQWTGLTVRTDVKEKLQRIFENDPNRVRNQKFGSWLDNLLSDLLFDERIKKYGMFLTVESMNDNRVTIMDDWNRKHFFHVDILPGDQVVLYCQEDASSECIHVGFCLALPQVYQALIRKGYTPLLIALQKANMVDLEAVREKSKELKDSDYDDKLEK